MPETIIESVLSGKIDAALLLKWLNCDTYEDTPEDCVLLCCNRSEFVAHFVSYLRNQTDSILRTNSNGIQLLQHQSTPEKILNSHRKHCRSISDPTSDDRTMDNLSVKTDRQRSHESPSKDKKRTGRRVKTKLFTDEKKEQSVSSDESKLSIGVERVVISSTPLKNGKDYPNLPATSPVTPNRSFKEFERCDTPRFNYRHSRSQEKSCLGDYLVTAQKSSKKKKGKNTSNDDSDVKAELDLSNSEMFPEIGVRKSSSLRSDRKRIKPTNIDRSAQKSFSLNSFTSECFQQPSSLALEDNIAFKNVQTKETPNSFEAERNILKQERHKLMEKFNILNTSDSPKTVKTPQIKVLQNNSFEKIHYIKSDANKVVLKDKIDKLVDIYDVLIRNNLILSMITEIYFLISIILSKQSEVDYENAESNLKNDNLDYLLKSIHNSTYFAVRSLWKQRIVLEVILDKNSLKILGENKKVRSFYPDLAKFLLNSYGLKCEAESMQEKKPVDLRPSNGVICFNIETDNVDNFPSMLSFQSFKKQRDMFYEILRWYQETQTSGGSRATFRARIKPLLSAGGTAANQAHLAGLFTKHMLANSPANTQESKLSKLQRRLTCPSATESHRLPHFTAKEMFYKEFIMNTDNESFRVHLRHTLASEIVALDGAPIADDRTNATNTDLTRDFLHVCKRLSLLGKFLGYLTALPYSHNVDAKQGRTVVKEQAFTPPKEKVLENELALRNYSQPCIDLQGLLSNAQRNSRLCITLPWLIHYLSMLDYASLRIKYFRNLTKTIYEIYTNLKYGSKYKKNTLIFLKSILGWLFDLPHYPVEVYYDSVNKCVVNSEVNIDCCDIIDETVLFEFCPYLKDINVLLSTCKVGQEHKESFRHITPVSLSLNAEDRLRSKEKELQARLEEELLKSQPSSTRRVLDLVVERVTSLCVRELVTQLTRARELARENARGLICSQGHDKNILQSLQTLYTNHVQQLKSSALQSGELLVRSRCSAAVAALLPHAPPPILPLAVKGCLNRLNKWINDHWNTTAILCKDIEAEMKTLSVLGECSPASPRGRDVESLVSPAPQFDAQNVSPAACIINLKEQICLLLEYTEPPSLANVLRSCAAACAANNVLCRAVAQRTAIMRLTVDLCLVYVSRKPLEVNESFLIQLHNIWNTCCPDRKKNQPLELSFPERREGLSPDFRNFDEDDRVLTPVSDDEKQKGNVSIEVNNGPIEVTNRSIEVTNRLFEGNNRPIDVNNGPIEVNTAESNGDGKSLDSSVNNILDDNNSELLEFFDRVLCPRNIVLLSETKCKASDVWEAMATVLVFLLKNDYLSEDSLTEQCLAVYRQDWPQNILESLSTCMKSVSSRWSRSSTGKFTLFLDFLAEYCGDMDYDPVD